MNLVGFLIAFNSQSQKLYDEYMRLFELAENIFSNEGDTLAFQQAHADSNAAYWNWHHFYYNDGESECM